MKRAATVALALCALASCESSQYSCPGQAQATLHFTGSAYAPDASAAAGNCPAPSPVPAICSSASTGACCSFSTSGQSITPFSATVSFSDASRAALCIQRTLAAPIDGCRDVDAISIVSDQLGTTISGCPCAVDVTETLAGNLTRSGSEVTGFDGILLDQMVRSASAAGCYASADSSAVDAFCPPPVGGCSVSYAVTGTP